MAYDSIIVWNKDRKITFADLQGIADKQSDASAVTYCFVLPIYTVINNTIAFKVISCLDKKKSWINRKIADTNTIRHEQGHFDIAELLARKMADKIGHITCDDSVYWHLYFLYNEINKELVERQSTYDKETDCSRNRKKQKIWDDNIHKMLLNKFE